MDYRPSAFSKNIGVGGRHEPRRGSRPRLSGRGDLCRGSLRKFTTARKLDITRDKSSSHGPGQLRATNPTPVILSEVRRKNESKSLS